MLSRLVNPRRGIPRLGATQISSNISRDSLDLPSLKYPPNRCPATYLDDADSDTSGLPSLMKPELWILYPVTSSYCAHSCLCGMQLVVVLGVALVILFSNTTSLPGHQNRHIESPM